MIRDNSITNVESRVTSPTDTTSQNPITKSRIKNQESLYTPAFRRPAAVVRNRRDIANRLHLDANRLQRTDRRLAARSRALHADLDRAQSVGLGGVGGADGRLRGGERRPLPR